MIILAIETSCDDTGIAIVEFTPRPDKGEDGIGFGSSSCTILSNIVNTQTIHASFGGVFPIKAKEEHIKNIEKVYQDAISRAKEFKPDLKIDAIAVTVGPGLEPSLWVGITFAKDLVEKLIVPIIPVNHMEGHLLSSLLPEYELNKKINFKEMPEYAISLLVSGGHTQIIQIENDKQNKYKILGTTLDDAVGEAYDKVARMLGLPYPGGPAISKLAEMKRTSPQPSPYQGEGAPHFPRPMLHSGDYNFSYSGLKTAVLYHIRDNPIKNEEDKMNIAYEFENAAIEVIIKKTVRAINETGGTHLLLGGGVSANKHLQNELEIVSKKNNFEVYYPVKEITGDNALMIAIAGYFNQKNSHPFTADGSLKL